MTSLLRGSRNTRSNMTNEGYGDDASDEPVSKQDNAHNAQASKAKAPGKPNFFKNMIQSGSWKVASGSQRLNNVVRRGSVRNRGESSNAPAGYDPIPKAPKTAQEEYQDRFVTTCPESLAELFEALEQGRHPEILNMAIDHKLALTKAPADHDRSSAHGVLWAMSDALKEKMRSGELDHIQKQTLEGLGRDYDWVEFS
jgi:hypothetical protein